MTPWTPLWRLAAGSPLEDRWPGEIASASVARQHVYESVDRLPNWKWHIATYAVTVWISRHWSSDEIASEVARMEEQRRAYPAERRSEALND